MENAEILQRPILILQKCLTFPEMAPLLDALHEVLAGSLALYVVGCGLIETINVRWTDLALPIGNGTLPEKTAPGAPRPPCPKVARFSDDPAEARRIRAGFYHPHLRLNGTARYGAILTAHHAGSLAAWILFFRDLSRGDLTDEEMGYLKGFQPQFEAACCRLLRSSREEAQKARLEEVARTYQLTSRELEILEAVHAGMTNREIAGSLSIALCTVKKHIEHLLFKTRCASRTELKHLLSPGGDIL